MKRLALLVIYLIPCTASAVQDTMRRGFVMEYKQDFSLLTGFHLGEQMYGELGLAVNAYGSNRHPYALDYFISSVIKIDDELVVGPKIGVWAAGGYAMGLNLIWYTDMRGYVLAFRPEMGIGINRSKLVFGWNIKCLQNSSPDISRLQISIVHCFTLKRLEHTITQR